MVEKQLKKNETTVIVTSDRRELGLRAGREIAARLRAMLEAKDSVNVVFAAAPSQKETLETLLSEDLPWDRIRAFHMDEYVGLEADHPAGFGNLLERDFFSRKPFKSVHYLKDAGETIDEICSGYSKLLEDYPIDLIVLGVGENGHLAFNDPPVADFEDAAAVKVVELDLTCRQQQVNDGCFESLDQVPTHAVTLTMSAIRKAAHAVAVVPGLTKAAAIRDFLTGEISTECPASMLRLMPGSMLFVDRDSMSALDHAAAGSKTHG